MVSRFKGTNDERCKKTRAALEGALYDFYAEHSHFEKLPIVKLCEAAKVSTPTFYRHYKSVHDVVMAKDRKINTKLKRKVGNDSRLVSGLVRTFGFIEENTDYYMVNILQQYEKPFENLVHILEPKILDFVKVERKTRRSQKVDQRICSEIENYLIFEIKWWIRKDGCDLAKSNERIEAVIFYSKCRIYEMERKLSKRH